MKFIFSSPSTWIWTIVLTLTLTSSVRLFSEEPTAGQTDTQNVLGIENSQESPAEKSNPVSTVASDPTALTTPLETPANPETGGTNSDPALENSPQDSSSTERETAATAATTSASDEPTTQVAASPEAIRLARFKAAARKRLVAKLTNPDGKPARIFVLKPMDYTSLQSPNVVTETITRNLQLYDPKLRVRDGHYPLDSVTLEQFRKAIARLKADVIIVTVMYPTNFDLYLYDKRTPFQIYAHTEPLSATSQYELTKDAAAYYTKLLVRRTLYRYIKNQYYELPRDNSPPVLNAEIPRYIASQESIDKVNREMRSNFFASVGVGAALSAGRGGNLWNSNLVGFEVGYNVWDRFYVTGGADLFAYNAAFAGAKYFLSNKTETFKLTFGLAGAVVADRKVFDWDQHDAIGSGEKFIVPSASILFPIVDIYLKADIQTFIGIDKRSYIFTLLPGILLMF